MGIANELSGDVAAAVFSHQTSQAERKDLVEIVRNFYSALRPLIVEERRRRLVPTSSSSVETLPSDTKAAAGSHRSRA